MRLGFDRLAQVARERVGRDPVDGGALFVCEVLGEEGLPVATAANGLEAMCWLREQWPKSCVVLLDLMMPAMDGAEFLRAKRADAAQAAIPAVIVTAASAAFSLDQTRTSRTLFRSRLRS